MLYPTAKSYIIHLLCESLCDRLRSVAANRLESFLKQELAKETLADQLMARMREEKPLLYRVVQPSELQITCFLKSNAKVIKEHL
jgi:hypothetical protein